MGDIGLKQNSCHGRNGTLYLEVINYASLKSAIQILQDCIDLGEEVYIDWLESFPPK